jgi:hypothetical protein
MAKKKDRAAVELGSKGGKARARALSKQELSEQGRRAAIARWATRDARRSKPNGTDPI